MNSHEIRTRAKLVSHERYSLSKANIPIASLNDSSWRRGSTFSKNLRYQLTLSPYFPSLCSVHFSLSVCSASLVLLPWPKRLLPPSRPAIAAPPPKRRRRLCSHRRLLLRRRLPLPAVAPARKPLPPSRQLHRSASSLRPLPARPPKQQQARKPQCRSRDLAPTKKERPRLGRSFLLGVIGA